jgi:glutamate-1-semialdehyde 2,1-aminomutase
MPETLNTHLFYRAKRHMPGGVNSPVRSFKAVGGFPIFIKSAKGAKIYSEGKKEFID